MNSNFFLENAFLSILVGISILAFVMSFVYSRKPTYKNQPDIVVHKADFSSLTTKLQKELTETLEKELTQARTELTTCQAERDNYKGLWEQSVERTKALGKALGQERYYWKAVSEGLQKEYDSMKQERDDWKKRADGWAEECKNWENTYGRAIVEIDQLESELDRGTEIITWMKADLESLLAKKREIEISFAQLVLTAYYRDGARFRRMQDNPEIMEQVKGLIKLEPLFMQQVGRVQRPKLLNVIETPKVVNEAGEDLRKKPRDVRNLDSYESIACENDQQLKSILEMFKNIGFAWANGGDIATWKPSNGWEFPETIYISSYSKSEIGRGASSKSLIPASDFLPAEQPTAELDQPEPIEPRPDHPCLKGCSKPDGCFCRPGTPRDGKVRLRHPREFFVEKGILPEQGLNWKDEENIIRKWAQPQGMEIRCRSGYSPADGIVKYEYVFTRPAVNSDFDVPQSNA